MPLFGGTRRPPEEELRPCPAWARDYLLFERLPKRGTPERKEFQSSIYGIGEYAGMKNISIPWLGMKRLWLKYRAELTAEWGGKLGHRGNPPGARFETDDVPVVPEPDPDPRECLRDPGDA